MESTRRAIVSGLSSASLLVLSCAPSAPATVNAPARSSTTKAVCVSDFSGPGARPVSPTTVANWYIKGGQLVYAVFLRGIPGWYNKRTHWEARGDSAGRIIQDFDVGGFRYSLTLDESSGSLWALGNNVNVHKANVILMDRTGDSAMVRSSERLEFCWPSSPDAVADILARSKATEAFVSGAPDT